MIYILYTHYVMYRLHYIRACMFVGKIFKIFLAHVGILFYLCTRKQETLTLKTFTTMMRVDYLTNENWNLCESHIVEVGDTHEVDVEVEVITTHVDYDGTETHAYKWEMCITTDDDTEYRWATQQEDESATDTFETLYKRMCAEMGITPLWKRV